jgi:predicted HNH restriction endonuclease
MRGVTRLIGQPKYVVDPVNDLKPVCPNCRAMIHRRTPPYSLEDQGLVTERWIRE